MTATSIGLGASLGEIGLQTSTALAMTIGLEHVRARTGSVIHNIAAWIFGLGAMSRRADQHRRSTSIR